MSNQSKRKLPTDVPSETAKDGLPQPGDGASARDYVRDVAPAPKQKTPDQKRDKT